MDESEKQIEEMAIICKIAIDEQIGDGDFIEHGDKDAASGLCAEKLFETGYRKADDVRREAVKEFEERLKAKSFELSHAPHTYSFRVVDMATINEIVKEYLK